MGGIEYVRNNVIHAVMAEDKDQGVLFRLHSKNRSLTKEQVFSSEEISNYAAHAAIALRLALGIEGSPDAQHTLPDRPEIPEFLRELIPIHKKEDPQPQFLPPSSQA